MEKVYLKLSDGYGPIDVGCKIEQGILIDVVNCNDDSIWDRLTLQHRATLARAVAREINKPVTVRIS